MEDTLNISSRERFKRKRKRKNKKISQQRKSTKLPLDLKKKVGVADDNFELSVQSEVNKTAEVEKEPEFIEQLVRSPEQIGFDVRNTEPSFLDRFERKIEFFEKSIQLMPFWKNFLTVFSSVGGLIIAFIIIVYSILIFDNLPDTVPIFYNHSRASWEVYDKSFFLIIPIISGVVNILLFRFSIMVYDFDRKFVYIVGVIQNIVNVLLIITIIQLLSLISVIK